MIIILINPMAVAYLPEYIFCYLPPMVGTETIGCPFSLQFPRDSSECDSRLAWVNAAGCGRV